MAKDRSRSDTAPTSAVTNSPFSTFCLSSGESPMSASTWSALGCAWAWPIGAGRLAAPTSPSTASILR